MMMMGQNLMGGQQQIVTLNSEGYPMRQGQPNCSHFMKFRVCKFGANCKFHHPQLGAPVVVSDSLAAALAPAGGGAPDDEALLNEWVQAKRAHDYPTADRIREVLRAKGIEPTKARPQTHNGVQAQVYPRAPKASQQQGYGQQQQGFQQQQQQFGNQFGAAPQQMYQQQMLPVQYQMQGQGQVQGEGSDTQTLLNEWVQAKRAHDYTTSDRIRDLLRSRGVEADKARPQTFGDSQGGFSAAPPQNQRSTQPAPTWVPGGWKTKTTPAPGAAVDAEEKALMDRLRKIRQMRESKAAPELLQPAAPAVGEKRAFQPTPPSGPPPPPGPPPAAQGSPAAAQKRQKTSEETSSQSAQVVAAGATNVWQTYADPTSGTPYYHNASTGETMWTLPT